MINSYLTALENLGLFNKISQLVFSMAVLLLLSCATPYYGYSKEEW